MTGLAGGFIGSMLFSIWAARPGLGFLLTLLIIGGLIFFLVRLLFGAAGSRRPEVADAALAGPGGRTTARSSVAATPKSGCRSEFLPAIHAAVQEAWGRGDLARCAG